ncbi:MULTISPECIES: GNAT family N-acetyltransferase [unclassified Pseudoalteromonas]|uniref:GNAT family N-acetyltransferase n=1 Tax=unclassified Pseudoalteromonas TaxID=194690 RepID=UPI002098383A|nr:GNAT family N-acetyltransferase [Pseudoalteromonas sp. XMcav2-N]MCO7187431.1 GNAT family N-acetyltransferase [Pseudoalteromonas sp. XMcav2-N]
MDPTTDPRTIELKKSKPSDIARFVEMEGAADTSGFILPNSAEQHRAALAQPHTVYLSIYDNQSLVGFIILARDGETCVEFRRIVVSAKGRGIGQHAISKMEQYCVDELGCKRIWLDVFAENTRGIHIYQKLGYRQFKQGEHNGQPLLFMEKSLQTQKG